VPVRAAIVSSPRLRRLAADYQALRAEYSGHPNVEIEPLGPAPPEAYRITYRLPGLILNGDVPARADVHVCEIRLPWGYPREQPYCVPLTPIFHPNIAEHYCIADYWSAGESLADIVAKIGDMIQYRSFNTKSPLDATAAYWAEQHPHLFPIGDIQLGQPEVEIALGRRSAPQALRAASDIAVAEVRLKEGG
jgi:ubiquitin-protein ligase